MELVRKITKDMKSVEFFLHSSQVMFINDKYFQINSEMMSTGGNYVLFANSNDI